MPNYDYRCESCTEVFEKKLSYEKFKEPEQEKCPVCQKEDTVKYQPSFGGLADPVKLGIRRPDGAFMHGVVERIKQTVPGADFSKNRFQASRIV